MKLMKPMRFYKGFTLIELLAVIVLFAVILAIAIPMISNIIDNSKEESYKNQVKFIEHTARIYVGQNPNLLPVETNESVEITLSELVENGLLPSIPKDPRTGNLLSETNVIEITKISDTEYTYEYIEPEPATIILTIKFADNVGNEGTYQLKNVGTSNEAYFFVGKNPNNWIQFGQLNGNPLLWRIINNNNQGIKIIYEGEKNGTSAPITDGKVTLSSSTWDTYGSDGSNKWERPASLKARLATWYTTLTIDQNLVAPIKWCIGDVIYNNPTLTATFLNNECAASTDFQALTTDTTPWGLIRPSDYISASSAATCTGSYQINGNNEGKDCSKLADGTITNFLYKAAYSWWTFTARSSTIESVWRVVTLGYLQSTSANITGTRVRPVLNLQPTVLFISGSGTLIDPYIIG